MKVSASIVIYNEEKETLKKVIDSFLSITLDKELIVVDNSPNNNLQEFCETFDGIKYILSNKNLGFGSGHNLAFKNLSKKSDVHMIINPDTYFNGEDIKEFLLWMNEHPEVVLSVPRVYSPDHTIQNIVREIPTPITLIKRRLNFKGIFDDFIAKDEFRDIKFCKTTEIPFAHGCFFLFQTEIFNNLNGFDERFFMYMEDVDIFIRAKKYGQTVINPHYKIYHEHRRGSSKNFKLLYYHINSAIKFFWKN